MVAEVKGRRKEQRLDASDPLLAEVQASANEW